MWLFLTKALPLFFSSLFFHSYSPTSFVLPHNPVLRPQINVFLAQNYQPKVNRVYLFSPNHQDVGDNIISNPADINTDHGISVIYPIIQNLYPQAQISTFLFRRQTSLKDLKKFSQQFPIPNSLYIYSIDFAHYLDQYRSLKNDDHTLSLLQNKDHSSLIKLSSDYLDCPQCLVLLSILNPDKPLKIANHFYNNGTSYIFASQ